MSQRSKIEICANSVESAVKAQEGGAYRVELCAGIPEGGTTPSFGDIRMARQLLQKTKLNVIIRPRGGDFLYSQLELDIMLHDIKVARQLGADRTAAASRYQADRRWRIPESAVSDHRHPA
jgi:copper homeostasis protein